MHKPHIRKSPNVSELISQGKIDLVINVPDSMDSEGLTDGFKIRRLAIDCSVGLLNDVKCAKLFIEAMHRKWQREKNNKEFWGIQSWQSMISME